MRYGGLIHCRNVSTMNYSEASRGYYQHHFNETGDMDDGQPQSFEVIEGEAERLEEVSRSAAEDIPAATRLPSTSDTIKTDHGAECEKYLRMILSDVGRDDGEKQPMNIVILGKVICK